MRPRTKWSIVAVVVLCLAAGFVWFAWPDDSPEARAERLVAELGARKQESLLSRLHVMHDTPDRSERSIARELAAVGDVGIDILANELCRKGNHTLWFRVSMAVVYLRDDTGRLMPIFVDRMKVDCPERQYAMRALIALGPRAADAAPDLADVLKDESIAPSLRYRAAEALSSIGPAAVPHIRAMLRDGSASTRGWAAVALAEISPAAASREAGQILEEAAKTGEKELQSSAWDARHAVELWQASTQPAGAATTKDAIGNLATPDR